MYVCDLLYRNGYALGKITLKLIHWHFFLCFYIIIYIFKRESLYSYFPRHFIFLTGNIFYCMTLFCFVNNFFAKEKVIRNRLCLKEPVFFLFFTLFCFVEYIALVLSKGMCGIIIVRKYFYVVSVKQWKTAFEEEKKGKVRERRDKGTSRL